MNKYTFAEIVADNFSEILKNFKSGLKSKGYEFIEDLMNDAFISCNSALKDRKMTKQEAIKYYWASYINKYKSCMAKNRYVSLDENYEEIDEPYNSGVDEIYDIIINELRDKFGIRKTFIWEMYACRGMSAKEIKGMGFDEIENFVYFNRKIKRYIHHHIIKDNAKLKELIDCRREA